MASAYRLKANSYWIEGAFQHFSLDLDEHDSILPLITQHADLTHLVYALFTNCQDSQRLE